MTDRDPYNADKIASQAELGRLLAPHYVTADELAGRAVPDPHRPAPVEPQEPGLDTDRVSLLQLPGESADEFRRRVPEVAGPQDMPVGHNAV